MRQPVRPTLAAIALVALLFAGAAHACGPETDCTIGERTYRIAVPDGDGPFGAIVFMHGWRSSAEAMMNTEPLRRTARALGVALVAPKSGGEGWLIRNRPNSGLKDDALEIEYFEALLSDITTRFPIDPARILASGFSSGGMMTWTLACRMPDRFAAFLPIAGTFWDPVPLDCAEGAVDLVHIHGLEDDVVPLEGRPIGDSRQGDVRMAIGLFERTKGYDLPAKESIAGLACAGSRSGGGRKLVLCLHENGHIIRMEWLAWAWRTLVAD
jgi:polyhydroxybutyrate depolymerase